MPDRSKVCELILQELESRLCSGNNVIREREWRTLVRTMRFLKMRPDNVWDAIQELLSDPAGRGVPPPQSPPQSLRDDYSQLPSEERAKIENRYRDCLKAAKRELPYVFYIDVINVPARIADLRFAARGGEPLPGLNENQRSIAKIFGIPEERYQLEVQAKLYGEERYRLFAERFWDLVMQAGKSYSLESVEVIYDAAAGKFYCELKCEGITRRAAFAAEVISAPIEHGDKEGIVRAKEAVKVWLEEILGRLAPTRP